MYLLAFKLFGTFTLKHSRLFGPCYIPEAPVLRVQRSLVKALSRSEHCLALFSSALFPLPGDFLPSSEVWSGEHTSVLLYFTVHLNNLIFAE